MIGSKDRRRRGACADGTIAQAAPGKRQACDGRDAPDVNLSSRLESAAIA
jgi:hypothetical protein